VNVYIDHGEYIELDGAHIPCDEQNSDYMTFLAWVDGGGQPAVPPEPSHAELWERAITETRALRQPILEVLDGLQASALTLGETSKAQVIETAKQGLRDITKLDLSGCATYVEMRQAVGAAYYALAAALPADIRQAFSEATT
jgi:hypothetical protein